MRRSNSNDGSDGADYRRLIWTGPRMSDISDCEKGLFSGSITLYGPDNRNGPTTDPSASRNQIMFLKRDRRSSPDIRTANAAGEPDKMLDNQKEGAKTAAGPRGKPNRRSPERGGMQVHTRDVDMDGEFNSAFINSPYNHCPPDGQNAESEKADLRYRINHNHVTPLQDLFILAEQIKVLGAAKACTHLGRKSSNGDIRRMFDEGMTRYYDGIWFMSYNPNFVGRTGKEDQFVALAIILYGIIHNGFHDPSQIGKNDLVRGVMERPFESAKRWLGKTEPNCTVCDDEIVNEIAQEIDAAIRNGGDRWGPVFEAFGSMYDPVHSQANEELWILYSYLQIICNGADSYRIDSLPDTLRHFARAEHRLGNPPGDRDLLMSLDETNRGSAADGGALSIARAVNIIAGEVLTHMVCLNTNEDLMRDLDSKSGFRRMCRKHDIPALESIELEEDPSRCSISVFKGYVGGKKYVVQKMNSSGGFGTYLFEDPTLDRELRDAPDVPTADLRRANKTIQDHLSGCRRGSLVISRYRDPNISVNVHAMITEGEVFISPCSIQIITLTDNRLIYSGADFEAFRRFEQDEPLKVKELYEYTSWLCGTLKGRGYRGIIGFDIILSDKIEFVEANNRFQASTVLLNKALAEYGHIHTNGRMQFRYDGKAVVRGMRLPSMQMQNLMAFYDAKPPLRRGETEGDESRGRRERMSAMIASVHRELYGIDLERMDSDESQMPILRSEFRNLKVPYSFYIYYEPWLDVAKDYMVNHHAHIRKRVDDISGDLRRDFDRRLHECELSAMTRVHDLVIRYRSKVDGLEKLDCLFDLKESSPSHLEVLSKQTEDLIGYVSTSQLFEDMALPLRGLHERIVNISNSDPLLMLRLLTCVCDTLNYRSETCGDTARRFHALASEYGSEAMSLIADEDGLKEAERHARADARSIVSAPETLCGAEQTRAFLDTLIGGIRVPPALSGKDDMRRLPETELWSKAVLECQNTDGRSAADEVEHALSYLRKVRDGVAQENANRIRKWIPVRGSVTEKTEESLRELESMLSSEVVLMEDIQRAVSNLVCLLTIMRMAESDGETPRSMLKAAFGDLESIWYNRTGATYTDRLLPDIYKEICSETVSDNRECEIFERNWCDGDAGSGDSREGMWVIEKGAYMFKVLMHGNISSAIFGKSVVHPNLVPPEDSWNRRILSPDVNMVALKIALVNNGITLSENARSLLSESGIREGVNSSVDLLVKCDRFRYNGATYESLPINCAFNNSISKYSPIMMEYEDGTLYFSYYGIPLGRRGEDLTIKHYPPCSRSNNIAFIATDRVRFQHHDRCDFAASGKGCKFCEFTAKNVQFHKKPRFEESDIMDTIRDTLSDRKPYGEYLRLSEHGGADPDGVYVDHVLIGGGTYLASPYDVKKRILDMCGCINSSSGDTKMPIYLMCIPPNRLGDMDEYKEAGVTEIAFNMEIYSQDLAMKYMPGKSRTNLVRYISALRYATRVWKKPGSVRSSLIIGLEHPDRTLESVKLLSSLGVSPILSIFRPVASTELGFVMPLSSSEVYDLFMEAYDQCKRVDVLLGPSCIHCQNNTVTLPPEIVEKVLAEGHGNRRPSA